MADHAAAYGGPLAQAQQLKTLYEDFLAALYDWRIKADLARISAGNWDSGDSIDAGLAEGLAGWNAEPALEALAGASQALQGMIRSLIQLAGNPSGPPAYSDMVRDATY